VGQSLVGGGQEPLPESGAIRAVKSKDAAAVVGDGPVLIGGTAWVFSRDEMVDRLDYLFVDEAGQPTVPRELGIFLARSRRRSAIVDPRRTGPPNAAARAALAQRNDPRQPQPAVNSKSTSACPSPHQS
jgi:uncharacterized protein